MPPRRAFWAVAFAFLVVMAFATVPSPLYGVYRERDHFSLFTVTVVYAVYSIGVIGSLLLAGHLSDWYGRRRLLLPALGVAIISAIVFLASKSLAGLVVGRLLNGIAIGVVVSTATAYLVELHAIGRPGATTRRAQLTAIGVAFAPETHDGPVPRPRYRPQRLSVPPDERSRFFAAAQVLTGTWPVTRVFEAGMGAMVMTAFVGISLPVVGAGIALARQVSPKVTILGFAIAVSAGIAGSAIKLVAPVGIAGRSVA